MDQLIKNANKNPQNLETQQTQISELPPQQLPNVGGGIVAFLL